MPKTALLLAAAFAAAVLTAAAAPVAVPGPAVPNPTGVARDTTAAGAPTATVTGNGIGWD